MERVITKVNCNSSRSDSSEESLNRDHGCTDLIISHFDKEVPSFVEDEIENLYQNIFSSYRKMKIYGNFETVSTYIARKGGEIVTIFLFRQENRTVYVMNELIAINEAEIETFSKYIFDNFESVSVITFSAIETRALNLSFPHKKFNSCENPVLALPGSSQEYLSKLGSSTRKNIKYYTNKIQKVFPSFTYKFFQNDEVTEEHIKIIIEMKHSRMENKGKKFSADQQEISRILSMVKACGGLVAIALINGRICSGQIIHRIGRNYFLTMIAHDPKYNEYSLGTICCYLTICECIARKGKEFHFLWGREDYKFRLLGVQRNLDNVFVFRSPLQLAINGPLVLNNLRKGCLRQIRMWLLAPENRSSFISKSAIKLNRYARKIMDTVIHIRTHAHADR